MRKIGLLLLIVILSIITASVYGFLHNQCSYSISPEYFTKFKFLQFWSTKYALDFPRMSAGLIGVASSWWVGLLLGLTIGSVGLLQRTTSIMWKASIGAIIRTLGIAITFGIAGILVGKFLIANLNIDWSIPEGITNRQRFLTAGTMHNFSYLGGLIGLIYGIVYQLKIKSARAQHGI